MNNFCEANSRDFWHMHLSLLVLFHEAGISWCQSDLISVVQKFTFFSSSGLSCLLELGVYTCPIMHTWCGTATWWLTVMHIRLPLNLEVCGEVDDWTMKRGYGCIFVDDSTNIDQYVNYLSVKMTHGIWWNACSYGEILNTFLHTIMCRLYAQWHPCIQRIQMHSPEG
jgi:hypothetical protein